MKKDDNSPVKSYNPNHDRFIETMKIHTLTTTSELGCLSITRG